MKKTILALILILTLALTACHVPEERHITCDEILAAYEGFPYKNLYHDDHETNRQDYCQISLEVTRDNKYEYVHFYVFDTFEEAEAYAEERKYNIAVWIIAIMYGESRWLQVGSFGNVAYEYYDTELYEPFATLVIGE